MAQNKFELIRVVTNKSGDSEHQNKGRGVPKNGKFPTVGEVYVHEVNNPEDSFRTAVVKEVVFVDGSIAFFTEYARYLLRPLPIFKSKKKKEA